MTSSHHSSFSCFPIDLNEDQHHQLPFSSNPLAPPPPPPSLSYPFVLNPPHDHDPLGGFFSGDHSQPLQFHEDDQAKVYVWHGGSSENPTVTSESGHKFSAAIKNKEYCRKENQTEKYNTSVKWMSSKMRIMRKMMNQDKAVGDSSSETSIQKFDDPNGLSSPVSQTNINNNNNSNNSSTNCNNTPIRVCSDCNTTKTPLWRSGPRGPKSLCNACGIRQRKARRAMAAAAAAAATSTNGGPSFGAGTSTAAAKTKVHHKEKKTNNIHLPFKKRCKFTAAAQGRGRKKFGFEDLTIILSKNSAYQRVFPQEEKEAAILLMALSYGLVHG